MNHKNIATRLQEYNPDMFTQVMAMKEQQYKAHREWQEAQGLAFPTEEYKNLHNASVDGFLASISTAYGLIRELLHLEGRGIGASNVVCLFYDGKIIGTVEQKTSKKDCMLIIAGGSVGNFITTDSSSLAIPADITKYLHVALNKEISGLDTEFKKDMGLLTKKEEFIEKVKDLSKEEVIKYLESDTTLIK